MNHDDQNGAPLRDLLSVLRSEWRDEAGGDELPPESLGDCDEATQRSVGWLRDAWRLDREDADLLPSVPVAQAAARLSARRRVRRLPRVAASLIAVAAAALLLITLWKSPTDDSSDVTDTPVAVGSPGLPTHVADDTPAPEPALAPPVHTTEYTPDRFRSRDDGIELISGSVRLVLLTKSD